jgi:hypothetical protein
MTVLWLRGVMMTSFADGDVKDHDVVSISYWNSVGGWL